MPKRLTARQLAARLNRRKRRGLTPEGREALRQAALKRRPWEHSTGPRSWVGKATSRYNAFRHGDRSNELMPFEFKAYASMVEFSEAIAPRGMIVSRGYLERVYRSAIASTVTAWRLLWLTKLTVRLVDAEVRAIERKLSTHRFD